jgi:hypothetical protein
MQLKDNSSLSLFKKLGLWTVCFMVVINVCSHDISDFHLPIVIELEIKLKNEIKKDILSKLGIYK